MIKSQNSFHTIKTQWKLLTLTNKHLKDSTLLPVYKLNTTQAYPRGGAENVSTGKRKYGKGKYKTAHFARMENACTENASRPTNLQGWKTQARKMQVQCQPSVR